MDSTNARNKPPSAFSSLGKVEVEVEAAAAAAGVGVVEGPADCAGFGVAVVAEVATAGSPCSTGLTWALVVDRGTGASLVEGVVEEEEPFSGVPGMAFCGVGLED